MGIRIRNTDEYLVEFNLPGTVTAAANKACALVPFTGFIRNIYAKLGTAGTGVTATRLDINKNGTTIFSATTTQVSLAATTGVLSLGTFTTDPPQVSAGDQLVLDADAVATSPANLSVLIKLSKHPPAACGSGSNQDTA